MPPIQAVLDQPLSYGPAAEFPTTPPKGGSYRYRDFESIHHQGHICPFALEPADALRWDPHPESRTRSMIRASVGPR